jgi:aspartate aminotransferase
MFISQRAQRTSPSPTLAITAKARKMREEGIDVLSFGAGEPDFDTPEFIKEAAVTALREGFTKYTPTAGIEPLRKAICDKLWRDNGLKYEPNQIIVTCGGKHALYNAFQVICDPGDEVIIPAPYWVSYPEMVKLADGVPVFVYADESTGFVPTIDAIREKISARTRAIVVNSPCNPTGAVFHRQRLKEIAALALRHDLYIVSDEIYEKMVYDGHEHVSIASLGEEVKKRTILVNGMSKAYSMTGWRIGYAAAERELIAAMTRIQDQSTSNPTSIAQKAALAALQAPEDTVKRMVAAFAERRRAIVDGLNRIPGFRCAEPGGAFYAFPNVSALYGKRWGDRVINNSDAFAEYLLEVARVAVVPGSGFGADENIRLSYACSLDTIRNGLARIADAVQALQE